MQTESESAAASSSSKKNLIDQYFGVEFETTYPFAFGWARLSIRYFCGLTRELGYSVCQCSGGLFLNSPVQYEMHRVRGGGASQGQGKPAAAQLLHQPRSQIPFHRTKTGMNPNNPKYVVNV